MDFKIHRIAIACALWMALTGGCKETDRGCEDFVAEACTCDEGASGARMCVAGEYGPCDCSGATAPSVPAGSIGECIYRDLGNGKRICLLSEPQGFSPTAGAETQQSALWPYPEGQEAPTYAEPDEPQVDLLDQCAKFTIHDQGDLGWCVAHSTVGAMELKHCVDNGVAEAVRISEPHLWRLGRPNGDMTLLCNTGGWHIQEAVNIAEHEFLAEQEVWPYPQGMSCETLEESQAADQAMSESYPGDSVLELRDDFVIHGHQHIDEEDAMGIRANLAAGYPVVTGLPIFNNTGWYNDEVDEDGVPLFDAIEVPDPMPTTGNPKDPYCFCVDTGIGEACPDHEHCLDGYHAIFIVGYDNVTQRFRMVNSWGPGWKENFWGDASDKEGGTFFIDYAYVEQFGGVGAGLMEIWRGDSSDDPVIPDDKEPGEVGTPCLNDAGCAGGEGICFEASLEDGSSGYLEWYDTGFLDGYCSVECKFLPGFECPEGATCLSPGDRVILQRYYDLKPGAMPEGVCFETCAFQETVDAPSPCRPGYGCHARGEGETGVCLPRCRNASECATGPGPTCSPETGACIWGCKEGMCTVPEGPFTMGCDTGDWDCGWGDSPAFTAILSAYEIDRDEVSVADYEACVSDGACAPRVVGAGGSLETADKAPANGVTWDQANAYCLWRGKRLCTEAEWEKAARGTADERETPWGGPADDIPCDLANIFWEKVLTGSPEDCHPGGQEAPKQLDWPYWQGSSPYGCQHMVGNLQEWTMDWADEGAYSSGSAINPTGPETGTEKITRGHHFASKPGGQGLRLSARIPITPTENPDFMGLRCCRDSDSGDKIPWDIHFLPPFMH